MVFGDKVADLYQRAQQVRRVNDIFFRILTRAATLDEVRNAIAGLAPAERVRLSQLESPDRLQAIRATDVRPSEKISAFLDILSDEIGLDLMLEESVKECLHALQLGRGWGRQCSAGYARWQWGTRDPPAHQSPAWKRSNSHRDLRPRRLQSNA